jgi:hypothetical protein
MLNPRQFIAAASLAAVFSSLSAADPPLTLTISGPQAAMAEDHIVIQPVLKNISDQKISSFVIGSAYTIVIHTDDGRQVLDIKESRPASAVPIDLNPGESHADVGVHLVPTYALPPGKYVVQFTCHQDPRDQKNQILTSNEIAIIIADTATPIPVTLSISGPETVGVAEPLVINPSFKNVSNHAIKGFLFGAGYTMLIGSESGKEWRLKPGTWTRGGSSAFADLQAGEVKSDFPARIDSGYNFAPGRYTVQLARRMDMNDPASPVIKSNQITINVPGAPVEQSHH